MRAFVLLSCAVYLAVARPQSGYNYPTSNFQLAGNQHQQSLPSLDRGASVQQSPFGGLDQLQFLQSTPSIVSHESHGTIQSDQNFAQAAASLSDINSGLTALNAAPIQDFSHVASQTPQIPANNIQMQPESDTFGPSPVDIAPSTSSRAKELKAIAQASKASRAQSTPSAPSFADASAPSFAPAPQAPTEPAQQQYSFEQNQSMQAAQASTQFAQSNDYQTNQFQAPQFQSIQGSGPQSSPQSSPQFAPIPAVPSMNSYSNANYNSPSAAAYTGASAPSFEPAPQAAPIQQQYSAQSYAAPSPTFESVPQDAASIQNQYSTAPAVQSFAPSAPTFEPAPSFAPAPQAAPIEQQYSFEQSQPSQEPLPIPSNADTLQTSQFSAAQASPLQSAEIPSTQIQVNAQSETFAPRPADIAPSTSALSNANLIAEAPIAPQPQELPLSQPIGATQVDQTATIHKHIYVHVPPADFDEPEPQPQQPAAPVNGHKHVQILFIKAPSPPKPPKFVLPAAGQNEEKTLVYVLVKKPEQADEIVPPQTLAEQKVNKPEVYFIKYNTKKEAIAATQTENPQRNEIEQADMNQSMVVDSQPQAPELNNQIQDSPQIAMEHGQQSTASAIGLDIPSENFQQFQLPQSTAIPEQQPSRKYVPAI